MNRNLWLMLLGAISIVSLMIAHRAGQVYRGERSASGNLLVHAEGRWAAALQEISEAFEREHPRVSVHVESGESDPNSGDTSRSERRWDITVSRRTDGPAGTCDVAICEDAANPRAARLWVLFLTRPLAEEILDRHGLALTPQSGPAGQSAGTLP